jgi:hypothetical protein
MRYIVHTRYCSWLNSVWSIDALHTLLVHTWLIAAPPSPPSSDGWCWCWCRLARPGTQMYDACIACFRTLHLLPCYLPTYAGRQTTLNCRFVEYCVLCTVYQPLCHSLDSCTHSLQPPLDCLIA